MKEKDAWIEIERLKAQMEALLKAREAMNERIVNLSERIGELRSSLVEHERVTSKLEIEAKKTIELVQKIKPEEIMKEITKFDAKIEALKARISSYEALIDRVVEEMKEMRRTFVQFRSLDAIAKMSEELKKDLEKGRKIEAEMSKHSSKVESMFVDIQKRYKEFAEISKSMEELKERFRLLLREFDKLRVDVAFAAKKEDFEKLEKKVDASLKEMVGLVEELKKRKEELKEIILSSEKMAEVSERVSALIEEREVIKKKLSLLDSLVNSFTKLKSDIEKLENRMVGIEEFRKRALTKEEVSSLKEELNKKMLELDDLASKIKEKIESWEEKMENVLRESKAVIEFSRKVRNLELSIKRLEERQKEMIKLLEAII